MRKSKTNRQMLFAQGGMNVWVQDYTSLSSLSLLPLSLSWYDYSWIPRCISESVSTSPTSQLHSWITSSPGSCPGLNIQWRAADGSHLPSHWCKLVHHLSMQELNTNIIIYAQNQMNLPYFSKQVLWLLGCQVGERQHCYAHCSSHSLIKA